MLPPALIISISIVAIEVVVGFIGNGFITAVNITNWIKSKKTSSADMILIFLSTSRCILQVTILMHIHSLYFAGVFKLASVYKAFGAVWMFVNHASLWFSTWLHVLYCVKIIHVTQWLLLQMKLRIAEMVPWLLLGSLVVSSATSFPLLWNTPSSYLCSSTGNCRENSTAHITDWGSSHLHLLLLYLVGCFFPLVLSVVTSALLITSLSKHRKKMQCYADNFRDPLIDVHLTAIKSIISFLVLYLSSFAAQILLILSTSQSKDVVKVAVSLVVVGAYPSIHSVILIIVNSKLKLAFRVLCQHFKCHLENMTLRPTP
ncbi:PREDICTED: taste receptor type 2 member 40-like [Buceros rhinoceros silvestris]|uniref:taste receptor type 2 member 40-like n=1 Tax=Buceros rhinoceros silvestris TaxID=175836 RepID=UPI0005284A49|nr:PREDICTED: taste receptor type 2 member 40-like [Buceros rhinoceros silvestris]